jgi:Domain of unknown function (DUF1707)
MADVPDLRVSDSDRDRVAGELREHYAAGRITDSELSDRLDATYAAKTATQLERQRADLPSTGALPVVATARELARRRVYHDVGAVALIDIGYIAVWLATGANSSFWPQWVILLSAFRLAFDGWRLLGPGAPDVPGDYRTWVERRLRL